MDRFAINLCQSIGRISPGLRIYTLQRHLFTVHAPNAKKQVLFLSPGAEDGSVNTQAHSPDEARREHPPPVSHR